MSAEVFVNFNGNCREAVEFYAEVFGLGKPEIMTWNDMPTPEKPKGNSHDCREMPITEEMKKLVMYTCLKIKGSNVNFSDVPPGYPFTKGNNVSIIVTSEDIAEIKSLFNKMKAGGTVTMDLQETFWSKCYGCLTDKFGVGWQFMVYLDKPLTKM